MADGGARKKVSLREENREHTRQRMLEAAYALFARIGYEQTTMEMIAHEAEVGRATLFKYFPNKQLLIMPLAQQILENELRPALTTILESSLPTEEALRAMFSLLEQQILSVPSLAQTFVAAFSTSESRAASEDSGFARFITLLVQMGQQRGEVRQDIAAQVIASYIAQLHTTIFVQVVRGGKTEAYMPAIDEMLRFMEAGWRER